MNTTRFFYFVFINFEKGLHMFVYAVVFSVIFSFFSAFTCFANPFPDFIDSIPDNYQGPLFKLCQDYPKKLPTSERPWEAYNFKKEPLAYMYAVRDYILEGMLEADWRAENNSIRKWYHMPWMHTGLKPRECLHGMCREGDSNAYDISIYQDRPCQNWGASYFNDYAAYVIGQVWKNPLKPNPKACRFPNGSLFTKLLFTDAECDKIPDLDGTVVWKAHINTTNDPNSPKLIKEVRLIQFDVAIRESRADETTGWVFGTFVFDKEAPGTNVWDKLVPVGISWGNDPDITAEQIAAGKQLEETLINPDAPEYAKKRLGIGGRLDGPLDGPESTCLSCHSTAQWKPISATMPGKNDPKKWLRNIHSEEPFDEGQIALGYCLQMLIALQNFEAAEKESNKQ